MRVVLDAYARILETLHADLEQAIAGLPQQALDWIPGPETNSLAVLLVHLAGAERYWIGELPGNEPAGRDRPAEFRVSGLNEAALRRQLRATLDHSRAVLARLEPADLERTITSPIDGRQVTVAWALAHAVEHTALHTGQVQLTRQLWGQQHAS